MSALAATDDARTCSSSTVPVPRLRASDRQRDKAGATLLVLLTTGVKVYGIAILLRFPIPSVAVSVVAVPASDLASGRQR